MADKYYKFKANENHLFHTVDGEDLIDENKEWAAITKAEYDARVQIKELKAELARTDYIVIKIAEAATTQAQDALRAEYAETIARRIQVREQINELEEDL